MRGSVIACVALLAICLSIGADEKNARPSADGFGDETVTLAITRHNEAGATDRVPVGQKLALTATATGIQVQGTANHSGETANIAIFLNDVNGQAIANGTSSPLEHAPYGDTLAPGTYNFIAKITPSRTRFSDNAVVYGEPQWSAWKQVVVVAVDKIIVEDSSPADEGPAFCGKKGTIRLAALPNQVGHTFPAGFPVWTIESKPSGSNLTDLPDGSNAVAIKPDVPGEYVVKAACGTSSDTFTVQVSDLRITAVEFTSDHNLLKDKDDGYPDGGTRYRNVEWQIATDSTDEVNDPMTHTWDTKVELKVTIELVAGAAAPGNLDIIGSGLGDFSLLNQAAPAAGTLATFTIIGTNKIPKSTTKVVETINWTVKKTATGTSVLSQVTGDHTMYPTADTPTETDVTLHRMKWANDKADNATTVELIADGIHDGLNANPPIDGNEGTQSDDWVLLSGAPYQGECDEQTRFMLRALELLGCSGTVGLAHGSTDANVADHESKTVNNKKYWLKLDFNADGQVDNNFEAYVETASRVYAVWPSLKADSGLKLLRKIGPDQLNGHQLWVRTVDDTWDSGAIETLPASEPFPAVP